MTDPNNRTVQVKVALTPEEARLLDITIHVRGLGSRAEALRQLGLECALNEAVRTEEARASTIPAP